MGSFSALITLRCRRKEGGSAEVSEAGPGKEVGPMQEVEGGGGDGGIRMVKVGLDISRAQRN